jgi:hypothetical protein
MTEEQFKYRHPNVKLQCGRSSEDHKWWVDARRADGRLIAAFRSRTTLEEALEEVDHACQRGWDSVIAEVNQRSEIDPRKNAAIYFKDGLQIINKDWLKSECETGQEGNDD